MKKKKIELSEEQIDRVIEMAWERLGKIALGIEAAERQFNTSSSQREAAGEQTFTWVSAPVFLPSEPVVVCPQVEHVLLGGRSP